MNDSDQLFLIAEKQRSLKNEKFVLVQIPLGREFQSLIFLGKKLEKNSHDCR